MNAKSKSEETEKSNTDVLTDQQIAAYLHGGGAGCPRCQSDNIGTTDSLDCVGGAGDATQQIECNECGLLWRDVYHLVGIEISL